MWLRSSWLPRLDLSAVRARGIEHVGDDALCTRLVVDAVAFRESGIGGVARVFRELLPRLCDLDPTLRVEMLVDQASIVGLPKHDRITRTSVLPVHRVLRPSRLWAPVLQTARSLAANIAVDSDSRTIWHSTYYTKPVHWRGPVVVTVHDLIYERFPELFSDPGDQRFRTLMRRCVLSADAVICVSNATRHDLEEAYGLPADRVFVVPLAASDVFRPSRTFAGQGTSWREPFILYVGARKRHKNFSAVLDAYSRWPQRTQVQLVVTGARWDAEEREQLVGRRIVDRVHVVESPSDEDLASLYGSAVGLVFPSICEGFGIPLLEAMACGCPVIASSIPTTHEVAAGVPIYFDPADPEGIISGMEQALAEGRSSPRVAAGLQRASAFSWDVTALGTAEVYRSALGS